MRNFGSMAQGEISSVETATDRKVVQISTMVHAEKDWAFVALCDDGSLWLYHGSWSQIAGGAMVAGFRFLFHFSVPVIGGLFAGATTNTPSLAAAQAALQNVTGPNPASGDLLGMAYAVAYPFGIVGIILTMLLVRRIFSIDVDLEVLNVEMSATTSERTPDFIDL
jgi:uncharacterized transporter YbjL